MARETDSTKLPTVIDVAQARLPAAYEAAKNALAECERIDECQTWANKAEALASYAKMANDDTLRQLADRIQARAIRRMGELLKQFDGRAANASKKQTDVTVGLISQKDAARAAGISERQQITAVRVANVSAEKFEAAIECARPATVTALAEMGNTKRPTGFSQTTYFLASVSGFSKFCAANPPEMVAAEARPHEIVDLESQVAIIDTWLGRFVVSLKQGQDHRLAN